MCVLEFAEENNKSEPVSHWENLVRIILVWCGQQDSNLHAFAVEPKSTESTNSTMPADGVLRGMPPGAFSRAYVVYHIRPALVNRRSAAG